jgi:penicillin-binding protein 1A
MAKRLGIKSPLAREAALALGTSEVSLMELTAAYDALANGGHTVEPYVVRRVRTLKGDVLFAHQIPLKRPAISAANVGAMNTMLNAAMTWGTGRRAALPLHPAAGKTGTSQSFRDAWFIGYTAYMTAGVWTGNDDGRQMNRVAGGGLPAEIWRDVMIAAHQGKQPMALPGTMPGVMPPPPPAPAPAADPSYPTGSIDSDFIARALDESQPVRPTQAPEGRMGLGGAPIGD